MHIPFKIQQTWQISWLWYLKIGMIGAFQDGILPCMAVWDWHLIKISKLSILKDLEDLTHTWHYYDMLFGHMASCPYALQLCTLNLLKSMLKYFPSYVQVWHELLWNHSCTLSYCNSMCFLPIQWISKLQKVFTLVPEKEKTEIKSKFVFNQRANGNHKPDKIYLYAILSSLRVL